MKLSDTFKTTQGIIALYLQVCLTLKILNKPRLNQLCEGSQNTLPNNEPNVPIADTESHQYVLKNINNQQTYIWVGVFNR